MKIIEANNQTLLKNVVDLANEIWNECYSSLISQAQIDYMLKNFLSFEIIDSQIKNEKYKYFLIKTDENTFKGFLAFAPKENHIFLSKIYLHKDIRGKGYAKDCIDFIRIFAKKLNLNSIVLTVNRENLIAVKAYKKLGFKIVKEADTDIGNGFFMNDFIMALSL
jgi:ribosomal protein S18 acetylase RimI-like enzyme